MANSTRGRRRLSSFEIAFGAVLLAGLPLAALLPQSLDGKFYAVIAVFAAALAAGTGYALLRRRPQADFAARYAAAPPELLSAVTAPSGTSGWSLALLRRLQAARFDELCAACGDALDAPPGALRTRGGNAISVGLVALREARSAFDARSIDTGVFVTLAVFSEEARAYGERNRIRLVDGEALLLVLETRLTPERRAALLDHATRAPQ